MKKILVAVGILAALLLGSELRHWWEKREEVTKPIIVSPTRRIAEADIVKVPVDLAIPQLPGKLIDKLRKEYNRPDLVGNFVPGSVAGAVPLGEFKIDCPPGVREVTVLTTLEPSGRVGVTARPGAPSFFDLPLKWQAGLDLDWADTLGAEVPGLEYGGPLRKWEAWVKLRSLRVGRVEVSPRLSGGAFFGIEYYGAGISISTP